VLSVWNFLLTNCCNVLEMSMSENPKPITGKKVTLPPWIDPLHVDTKNFQRTSGDCICRFCGIEFYKHPPHPIDEFLVVSCEGVALKL
jgi:hypothetical protein